VGRLQTEVLVVGSGAGGAITAARLADAGRDVTVVEEGPWVDPDAHEPFSLGEMVSKYRHRGPQGAFGNPVISYVEGRCVGGSTEINSGLYHRLPAHLAESWRRSYDIDEFGPELLAAHATRIEEELGVSGLPGAPPPSSAVLERGATKLGWRNIEFDRVFRYDQHGRGTKQTMSRTMLPKAVAAGARIIPDCRVLRLRRADGRVTNAECRRLHPDGGVETLRIVADHVVVCAGAIQTPALLQRSGIRRNVGNGLKVHPTIKITARFPYPLDHGDVPMNRVTEFDPHLTLGGSASRRGYIAMGLAEATHDIAEPLLDWENMSIYYAAIRSEGSGRVLAVPGLKAPLVTYKLTEADMSRLAQGLVHLGEVLLAAGATELYPSLVGGPIARSLDDVGGWWDHVTRSRANLQTVHLFSTVRMGNDRSRTGADSFGRVWDHENLYVNDGSLLPGASGVNPQAAIMTIADRNVEHFLAATSA
jgi:choline dehydrogenase-like flavoprotein